MLKKPLFIFFSIILITGCVSKNSFRPQADFVCELSPSEQCIKQARLSVPTAKGNSYLLSFFEFDDQGFLHNKENKSTIIHEYKNIAATEDVILIVFVHGWHHTADSDPEDSNITSFREILANASDYLDKKVLGVYVGWRGDSVRVPLLDSYNIVNWSTFWERKNTAHEIGTQGLTDLMLELEEVVQPRSSSNHKMLSIGHSFGGAALFSSIKPVLAERLIQSREKNSGVEGFGDLVLLMNPAFEGTKYASLFELSQNDCKPYISTQKPRFISLSSSADLAVKWLFPTGRRLSTIAESYRDVSLTHCKDGESIPTPLLDTEDTDRYGMGHNSFLISHTLTLSNDPETKVTSPTVNPLLQKEEWDSSLESGTAYFANFELKHNKITDAHSPYMNIHTDSSIMDGHNDIWNDNVKMFIYQILNLANN
ncbi:hypothetical protein [Pseudoalteromonas sp. CH_XMU1449-3]|uniref:hypothetical protein n=1 Tax=Pseudoalteromonas sp. CH_XMU1449-3 TaxID=3107774 RepID=UPI00300A5130